MTPNVSDIESAALPAPWTLFSQRRRIFYLVVLSLVATSNFVDRNVLGILLEPIKHEFGVSDTLLGLLTGLCFALFYATLGIPIARWADWGDRPLIVKLALIVWSIMTVLCGAAQNFAQLALLRIGVGAGEAGAVPPSQSLIADYFPPGERARAFAVFTLASTAGYLFGFSGGGWVAQTYGWRTTFVVVGLPGLLLALLVHWGLRDPRHAVGARPSARAPTEPLSQTLAVLGKKPAFLYVLGSMVLYYFLAYGALIFTTSFIVRIHHLSLAQAGSIFGLVTASAAVLGSLLGGVIADAVSRRGTKWLCRLCALGLVLSWPLHVAAFLTPSAPLMFGCLFVSVLLLSGVVPSQYTALHMVCGSRRRATAIAIALLVINLVGMGLGPIVTGLLSDHFRASLGSAEGLRMALVIVLTVFVPSGGLMLMAERHLPSDLEP